MVMEQWQTWKDFLLIVKIFEHLDDNKRQEIAMNLSLVQFNDCNEIIGQGTDPNAFFIILEGNAIVYQTLASGDFTVLSKLTRGDYFGALALLTERPHTVTVKAENTLKCLKMDRQQFQREIQPILTILKQRAKQYNSFVKLFV